MKKILLICLLVSSSLSYAHPGIGIVKDSKGNIYYTDLKQIWKIDKQGNRKVVVARVHSHEICIDGGDNLYGEHLWYNGEKADTWGYYVWRLRADGKLDTMIGPAQGFPDNYSFQRDAAGNMYWIQQWKPKSRIKKRTPDGRVTVIANIEMPAIGWMHVATSGNVYFSDRKTIYKLDNQGRISTVAADPGSATISFRPTPDNRERMVWGIWTDKMENIYCADLTGKKVIRISSGGKLTPVVYGTGGWFPLSGVFDESGNLWLMEGNKINGVRVRKISEGQIRQSKG